MLKTKKKNSLAIWWIDTKFFHKIGFNLPKSFRENQFYGRNWTDGRMTDTCTMTVHVAQLSNSTKETLHTPVCYITEVIIMMYIVSVSVPGIPRLVQLCKDQKTRNNSDAVLVASLVMYI